MAIAQQKEARNRDCALLISNDWGFFIVHSTIGITVLSRHFNSFGVLYMHNHDDKYPAWPGFKPNTGRLKAPVDMNESSGTEDLFEKHECSTVEWIKNSTEQHSTAQ